MRCSVILSALLVAICLTSTVQAEKPIKLFNGEDLSNWGCFLMDEDAFQRHPSAKLEDVWSVEDGILVCKGTPMGYLCTKEKFTNFEMEVKWRWAPGTKPGNSGVLLRISGKEQMLPKCVEAQLQSGNAGFIWGFHGFTVEGDADRIKEIADHKMGGQMKGIDKMEKAENEPGKWNTYTIRLKDDKLTLKVNDKLVNEATGLTINAGPVALQSEGGEIHFRSVKIWPID